MENSMNGLQLAQSICPHVYLANRDYYDWRRRAVFLRRSVAMGSGPFHLLIAAHEAAHHYQHGKWPCLSWAHRIIPLWPLIEAHAWLWAVTKITD